MAKTFIKYLNFLNLIDAQNRLSISNIAVLIVLIKLIVAPSTSLTEVGTMLIALGNYAYKRKVALQEQDVNSKISIALEKSESRLNDIESNVAAAMLKVGLK